MVEVTCTIVVKHSLERENIVIIVETAVVAMVVVTVEETVVDAMSADVIVTDRISNLLSKMLLH